MYGIIPILTTTLSIAYNLNGKLHKYLTSHGSFVSCVNNGQSVDSKPPLRVDESEITWGSPGLRELLNGRRILRESVARIAIQFTLLMAFWIILSGRLELKYLLMGVIAVSLVLWRGQDLLRSRSAGDTRPGLARGLRSWIRFIQYLPWLLVAIVKANVYVAYLVLHPRAPIDPVLLRFRTNLRSDISQLLLAHSITLTPGTITIDTQDHKYLVHAIHPSAAGDLVSGNMQNRVARVFGFPQCEEHEPTVARKADSTRP